jgi:hypothetical protein
MIMLRKSIMLLALFCAVAVVADVSPTWAAGPRMDDNGGSP